MTIIRKERKKLFVQATRDVEKGEFCVPPFVRNKNSIVCSGEPNLNLHLQAASATVILTTPTSADGTVEETSHKLWLQPEIKLPKPAVAGTTTEWDLNDNVHPFWVLPRQQKNGEVTNCHLVQQVTTVVACTQSRPPGTDTYRVTLPYITNTCKIQRGEAFLLAWELPPKKEHIPKVLSAFDAISIMEKKRDRDAPREEVPQEGKQPKQTE